VTALCPILTTITTTMTSTRARFELPTERLEGFRARAGALDATNAYFEDDLAELRSLGYLAAAVPEEFGGTGLDLAQLAASQRRLARYAPATALAVTMHSYWVGIATELERAGDSSLRWIFDAALPARCSPPATPRRATTSPCSCRPAERNGSRVGTG
jgi:alkylation response protein AidB-like acyl-CoA dehydrogenase